MVLCAEDHKFELAAQLLKKLGLKTIFIFRHFACIVGRAF